MPPSMRGTGPKRGGRLVYVGAGTSGRIAVQDGTELGPTYDWPSDRTVFVMAGGMQAVLQSVEGPKTTKQKGRKQSPMLSLMKMTLS